MSNKNKRLKLAGIGCGGRTRTYLEIAAALPHLYEVVAVADPIAARRAMVREKCANPDFREFANDREILAQPKLADVMIIGTQDDHHVEPCMAAMERGYDILLEKPVATNLRDVLALERRALELGRRVLVCHVLRYAPFYTKVKEIISSGVLGEIITLNASEGVHPWHQAHSFVRGHWAVTEKSTPMIIAKSCHDMDIISWLMDRPCSSVSSYGGLSYFTAAKAPAGAPLRCTDGCPAAATCPYDARLYLGQHKDWLQWIYDRSATATDAEILAWLAQSPWGRCVYHCDNTAVDHQVAAMEFEGGATATFTMTAFDSGRNLEIMGTKGVLRGGDLLCQLLDCDILIDEFASGNKTRYKVNAAVGGYAGHGGGDPGLVLALYDEMSQSDPAQMRSSITRSIQSHLMGFAAEASRLTGKTVHLDELLASMGL
jgi:predicted dehydrogenase